MSIMKTNFDHDCSNCICVGVSPKYDFYFCDKSSASLGGSLLARYGSDGPDYVSMPVKLVREALPDQIDLSMKVAYVLALLGDLVYG